MPDWDAIESTFSGGPARRAVGAIDQTPDEAARARQLSEATGVPSSVIKDNIEDFESRHRSAVANQLILSDSALQRYINATSTNAATSNDDWGNLADLSAAIRKYSGQGASGRATMRFAQGFLKGFGSEAPGTWQFEDKKWHMTPEFLNHAAWAALGFAPEFFIRGMQGVAEGGTEAFTSVGKSMGMDEQRALKFGASSMAALNVVLAGAGFPEISMAGGMPKSVAPMSLREAVTGIKPKAKAEVIPPEGPKPPPPPPRPEVMEFVNKAGVWMEAGQEPPKGMSLLADLTRKESQERASKALQEVEKALKKSSTYKRSLPAIIDFLRQHPDASVGITPEGLKSVYPEGTFPEPGDGKLGDLKAMHQFEMASQIGGVDVPLVDWLTKVPEHWRANLKDHLIGDEDGISKVDWEDLQEVHKFKAEQAAKEAPPPVDQSRTEIVLNAVEEAAGLKPYVLELDEKYLGTQEAPKRPMERPRQLPEDTPEAMTALRDTTPEEPSKAPGKEMLDKMLEEAFTKPQRELWMKRTDKELQARADFLNRIEERKIRKRQTSEWRQKALEIRDDVAKTIVERPDWAIDAFLRDGILSGTKVRPKPKLNSDFLTDEQIAGLPEQWLKEGKGHNPDEIAHAFGFDTGDELVQSLIDGEEMRRQVGQGIAKWRSKAIDAEVEARLQKEFGSLDGNILEEAQEFLISPTIMEKLHEHLVALGAKVYGEGYGPSLQGQPIRTQAEAVFLDEPMKGKSVKKFLSEAGRFGNKALQLLNAGKDVEAFQAAQNQYLSMEWARQAAKLEKYQRELDIIKDRFGKIKKDDQRLTPEHRNFVHLLLEYSGHPTGWMPEQLNTEITQSKYSSFAEFQDVRFGVGSDMDIAGWVGDIGPLDRTNKPPIDFDEITVRQFGEYVDSLKDVIADGTETHKVMTERGKEDFHAALARLQMSFEKFEVISHAGEGRPNKAWETIRAVYADSIALENLWDRIALNDKFGAFNTILVYPLAKAAGQHHFLDREIGAMIKKNEEANALDLLGPGIGHNVQLDKQIPNTLFKNPITGEYLKLTRENIRAMIQYAGEKTAWDKFTRGWQVEPNEAFSFLEANSTRADWEWAQGQGKIYEHLKKLDDARRRAAGFTPVQGLVLRPILAHGIEYEGWYQPYLNHPEFKVAYNEKGEKIEVMPEDYVSPDAMMQKGYTRAEIARRWDFKRTNIARPTNLYLDSNAMEFSKRVRDIAFRDALVQTDKFFRHSGFQNELTKRFGPQWTSQLQPYLRDITNQDNFSTTNARLGANLIEGARQSFVAFEVGWKLTTFMKHVPTLAVNSITQVGGIAFAQELVRMAFHDLSADRNYQFAMKTFPEASRRIHGQYGEMISSAQSSIIGKSWRQVLMELSGKPMAIGDLLTTIPMSIAEYKAAMKELANRPEIPIEKHHEMAVQIVDRAIRMSHGSTMISHKPAILRSNNPVVRSFTSFYGVTGHLLQRGGFELPYKILDTVGARGPAGKLKEAQQDWSRMSALTFSYVMAPIVIIGLVGEELFDEKSPIEMRALRGAIEHFSGFFLGVRELGYWATHGHADPGLQTSYLRQFEPLAKDIVNPSKAFQERNLPATMKHLVQALGAVSGVIPDQFIRTGNFINEWRLGKEDPHGVFWGDEHRRSIVGGLIRGTSKYPKHRR